MEGGGGKLLFSLIHRCSPHIKGYIYLYLNLVAAKPENIFISIFSTSKHLFEVGGVW